MNRQQTRKHLTLLAFAAMVFGATATQVYAEDATPAPEKEQPEATVTTKDDAISPLGRYVEVKITTNDLVEFQGWIREKAMVEVLDRRRNAYLQLQDIPANREIDGAGVRLYYVDRMQGFMFISHAKIFEFVKVREISQNEENAWKEALEKEIQERRDALRAKLEEQKRLEEEAKAEEEITKELEGLDPGVEIPEGLKAGYKLLDKFPAPEWGESAYKRLRKMQLTQRKTLTDDEKEFVTGFLSDWKPAFQHKEKNQK